MKYKLTMVSVTYRGIPKVIFVKLPLDANGKTIASSELINSLASNLGACQGETYSYG